VKITQEIPAEAAMKTNSIGTRALAALLFVALVSAALAPAALADRSHVRTKRGRMDGPGVVRVVHRGPYFVERHSDAGAIVGFLGGLVVGSILSNTPPPPPPAYLYFDPYCQRNFVTVGAYDEHLYYHRHPRSLEVIEVHSGRCVDTLDRRDGRWCSRDDHPQYEEWDE
jgi:hypothetical protein